MYFIDESAMFIWYFAVHCSHCRSYLYYIESINEPMSFGSWKCNSIREFNDAKCTKGVMNFMGHHANRKYELIFIIYILLELVISCQST